MKKTVTWVLTIDHRRARAFSSEGRSQGLQPVESMTMEEQLPVSHEVGSHRPDIGFAGRGGPSHGFAPRTTPHDQTGIAFVDRVVDALAEAAGRGAFQRLVLIAAPRSLGELRERLPEVVRSRLVAELDLDLTKGSIEGIRQHVDRFLA